MKIIVAAALAVGVEMTSRTTAIAITVGALLFGAGTAHADDMDDAFLKFLAQHGVVPYLCSIVTLRIPCCPLPSR
jgi:hypothetical protein